MNDNIAFFSFIGMLFCGTCAIVGFYVIGRAAWTAVVMLWSRGHEIDRAVENDLKIRIER